MVAGPRSPWSCPARCRMVLALVGFGQGRGMLLWWHWGRGLCWVTLRGGSLALSVQRAQRGAQGVKHGENKVKMEFEMGCKAQPSTTNTPFPPAVPPDGTISPWIEVGDTQASGTPGAWGYSQVRCSGTSEEGTRSWDPPLCPHCLTLCTPARVGGRGGAPPLGAPSGEVQPRGCWAEPFATYWCGVSVGLGCRGAGLCRGAPSTHLGQWVLHPGEAPAPAGRSCRASLLTPSCLLSSRNAPGT